MRSLLDKYSKRFAEENKIADKLKNPYESELHRGESSVFEKFCELIEETDNYRDLYVSFKEMKDFIKENSTNACFDTGMNFALMEIEEDLDGKSLHGKRARVEKKNTFNLNFERML